MSSPPSKLQNRISVAEEFGTTPLRILMRIATDPNSTLDHVITCAIAAANFCHPKLKQIEVNDHRERRDPDAISRDITHLIERLGNSVSALPVEALAGRSRDLIGLAERAGSCDED